MAMPTRCVSNSASSSQHRQQLGSSGAAQRAPQRCSSAVLCCSQPQHSPSLSQHRRRAAAASAGARDRSDGPTSTSGAQSLASRAAAALAAGTISLASLLAPVPCGELAPLAPLLPFAPAPAEARGRLTAEEQLTIDVFKKSVPSVVNVTNLAVRCELGRCRAECSVCGRPGCCSGLGLILGWSTAPPAPFKTAVRQPYKAAVPCNHEHVHNPPRQPVHPSTHPQTKTKARRLHHEYDGDPPGRRQRVCVGRQGPRGARWRGGLGYVGVCLCVQTAVVHTIDSKMAARSKTMDQLK
jgi:hypothetical protein